MKQVEIVPVARQIIIRILRAILFLEGKRVSDRITHVALDDERNFDDTSLLEVIQLLDVLPIADALSRRLWIHILANFEVKTHRVAIVDLLFKISITDVLERAEIVPSDVVNRIISVGVLRVVCRRKVVHLDWLKLICRVFYGLNYLEQAVL